jgi:sodium/hydrogen antiporter
VLNGVTFVLFGAILLGPALGELTWGLALYAVISLTLVRMLPVAIAMFGTRARMPTLGFMGWFGPRGLASIVFAVIVIEQSNLPHEHLIVLAIYVTVGLSVFAHGLTAAPLAARYAGWYEQHPRENAPVMETVPIEVTRARGRSHPRASAGCPVRRSTIAPLRRFEGGLPNRVGMRSTFRLATEGVVVVPSG